MKIAKFKIENYRGGYTIIETMIAVSIFLVIVVTGMGALLNANLLHQKSRDVLSIMDNLSFIMEDVSKNLRTGYDYHCIDGTASGSITGTDTYSCPEGGAGISFKSAVDDSQWVYAIYGDGTIQKSTSGGAPGTFVVLTSSEIEIDVDSGFSVFGAEPPPGNSMQPFVTIRLAGKITYKNVVTPFSLQTSVSQRAIDI